MLFILRIKIVCEEMYLNYRVQELKIGMAAAIPIFIALTGSLVEEPYLINLRKRKKS
ncbi:hypothetical protein SAMN04488577_2090 [Bacillus sp. cl95]|nr:hypothetical protein SAMN02799634_103459 [Bacillus sp. UNCCL13]SFQ81742.1 hypothetical protein SAMN04488577_2090 [Bacillus sp. cl95]